MIVNQANVITNDKEDEEEEEDIIGEFAKQYAREAKLEEIAEEYKGNAP